MENNSLAGILDIVPPLAHVDNGWGIFITAAIIIVLSGISISLFYYWWHSPRQHSKRQLALLLHQHNNGQIAPRQAIFRLAMIMRERIHCHQLDCEYNLPTHIQQYQSRWSTFINELDLARYSDIDIDAPRFQRLASEACFWVGRW